MTDNTEEARNLAAYALAMLTMKESSVEAGVRAVLRIATLLGQSWWQVWAQLQLTELVDEDTARDSVRPMLEHAFPDQSRREQIVELALADMLTTRVTATGSERYYLANIADIEHDLPIYEASLMRAIEVDRLAQCDLRRAILNRVKNRTQSYLMAIEARSRPPHVNE